MGITQNPPHKNPCDEIKKIFEEEEYRIRKINNYERINHNQVVDDFIPHLSLKSELSKSQLGKTLIDPSLLYVGLDAPITLRKLYIDIDVQSR